MRIWASILAIGLHLRFRGDLLGKLSCLNPALSEDAHKASGIAAAMDVLAMGVAGALLVGIRPMWVVAGAALGLPALIHQESRSPQRRIRESEWLIHLLIGSACDIADGNRFEPAILSVGNNPLVETLLRSEGTFERRLNQLARRLDNRGFNRLVSLYRQVERFDDAALMDEIERLIDWVQRDIFTLRKERAQRLNEWMVVPMILGLVNMMVMVVLPHLRAWA